MSASPTVVGGFALPHNPFLPDTTAANPQGIDGRSFGVAAKLFEELAPDVVVSFSPDHLNTLFFDNLPALLVGIVDEFSGPNDDYPAVAARTLRSDRELASHLYLETLRAGFDLARSESISVDHSVLVPLQVMGVEPTVVPVIMNVLAPPILNASRAHAFGVAVGEAIRSCGRDLRVLFLANGGISQEVGGPRSDPGKPSGAPGKEWLAHVVDRLGRGEVTRLAEEATPRRIAEAGNAAGELLTVLAMLGALGASAEPRLIEPEPLVGHMFGLWTTEKGSK